MNAPRVCAVILTFEGLEKVKRCLAAVARQERRPEAVVVVDNHSSDGTREFLAQVARDDPTVTVFETSDNLGPAGGFHEGLRLALEGDCNYLWLLDDDSVPEPGCLAALLAAVDGSSYIMAWPTNLDETGRETTFPAWRGELLGRTVVEAGGLPLKELFWGQEDTEYLVWRLKRQNQVPSIRVAGAVVRYSQANPRKRASWHYYYLARNTLYYRLWVQRPRKLGKLARSLVRLGGRALLVEDHKLRKIGYLVLGVSHGLRRRLGKTVGTNKA